MCVVKLDLNDGLVQLLSESNKPFEVTARELIVVELLGMSKLDFIPHVSALGIPFFSPTKEE